MREPQIDFSFSLERVSDTSVNKMVEKAQGETAIIPSGSPLKWCAGNIPSQAGKLAVITGATSGLGFETAIALAQAGADVVVAGRNESQGRWVVGKIRPLAPASLVRFERLDLADLSVVADFSRRIERLERPLDLLINNAGVMALPQRQLTPDGHEVQLASNYLGHFALTGRLLPLLRRSREPKVVQVSSISHRLATIDIEDLNGSRRYRPLKAYGQSKLAMLMFAIELQRRSDTGKWRLMSVAAHPGYARTSLFEKGPGSASLIDRMHRSLGGWIGHSAASGALAILYAATGPRVRPGEYYGPQGLFELAGLAGLAKVGKRAKDRKIAQQLWNKSERLTGFNWPTV
jgi:NAD(P)-dependent dehydrogenase (short-subunit alcohol dehydrogenase family)